MVLVVITSGMLIADVLDHHHEVGHSMTMKSAMVKGKDNFFVQFVCKVVNSHATALNEKVPPGL